LTGAIWKEKSDTIQFSDTTLTISRYYLDEDKMNKEKEATSLNQVKLTASESEIDERKGLQISIFTNLVFK
jgi:hypothetical protein